MNHKFDVLAKRVARSLIVNAALALAGLAVFPPHARAQGGVPLWTNRFSGPDSGIGDTPRAVAVDNSGNVFVTGYSDGVISGWDYATVAYSNGGVPLWTNRYNGSGNSHDFPQAVAVDSSGTVFVTGSSFDFSFGNAAWATVAYSGAGVPLWTNRYSGPGKGAHASADVAVGNSGTVFVVGQSVGSSGDNEFATVAYSSTGVPLWTNLYIYNGGPGSGGSATAVAVSSSGTVLVTGSTTVDTNGTQYFATVTVAYSAAGMGLWTNPGPAAASYHGLALDSRDNLFVTGISSKGQGPDPPSEYYFTLAYSSEGVPLWTNWYKVATNFYFSQAPVVAVDRSGNVFVTGASYVGTNGVVDYATVAYSGVGMALWTNRYNGPANNEDVASSVVVDRSGNVIVAGYSSGGVRGYSLATVAYSGAGLALWTNRFEPLDHNSVNEFAHLAVDRDGNVFLTGSVSNGSDYDYVTIKYSSSVRPYLEIQTTNNQAVLTWANPGFGLQSAPVITGTFTNVPGATSPHANPFTGSQQYFRLKSN